jgi:hypothetical protein
MIIVGYIKEASGIMDKVVYNLFGDSMLLSDNFRIANFIEPQSINQVE